MSALRWSNEIADIAGPMKASDTRESWLARAARRSGITFRQCKALYYGETKDPKASIAVGVLSAADKARQEARNLASRFESTAGAMHASDPDFFGEDIAVLINAARRLRGQDSP